MLLVGNEHSKMIVKKRTYCHDMFHAQNCYYLRKGNNIGHNPNWARSSLPSYLIHNTETIMGLSCICFKINSILICSRDGESLLLF